MHKYLLLGHLRAIYYSICGHTCAGVCAQSGVNLVVPFHPRLSKFVGLIKKVIIENLVRSSCYDRFNDYINSLGHRDLLTLQSSPSW